MSRVRRRSAPWIAALLAVACADAPTAPPADPAALLGDLFLPTIDPALLVEVDTTGVAPPGGPQLVGYAEGDDPFASGEETLDEAAAIYDERTIAGFEPGAAYAFGEHSYLGNKSRIETTVHVLHQGQTLGSHTAARENDGSFWFNFGRSGYISARARYYVERNCGLAAWGGSVHEVQQSALYGVLTAPCEAVPEQFAVFLFQGEARFLIVMGGATGKVAPVREGLDFVQVGQDGFQREGGRGIIPVGDTWTPC